MEATARSLQFFKTLSVEPSIFRTAVRRSTPWADQVRFWDIFQMLDPYNKHIVLLGQVVLPSDFIFLKLCSKSN